MDALTTLHESVASSVSSIETTVEEMIVRAPDDIWGEKFAFSDKYESGKKAIEQSIISDDELAKMIEEARWLAERLGRDVRFDEQCRSLRVTLRDFNIATQSLAEFFFCELYIGPWREIRKRMNSVIGDTRGMRFWVSSSNASHDLQIPKTEVDEPGPTKPLKAYANAVKIDSRTLKKLVENGEVRGIQESPRKWSLSITDLSSKFAIPKTQLRNLIVDYDSQASR